MSTYQRNRQAPLQINVVPTDTTRLGRMLQGGRLTATMRSKKTGEHITLTLHAMAKLDGSWKHVVFSDASHVFIKMGMGEYGSTKIGTYYPQKHNLYWDSADRAWQYAALNILLSSESGKLVTDSYEVFEESRCGVCGKALTDPISIERGIGPTCLGAMTGSQHYHAAPAAKADNLVEDLRPVVSTPSSPPPPKQITPATDKKGRSVPRSFQDLVAAVNR